MVALKQLDQFRANRDVQSIVFMGQVKMIDEKLLFDLLIMEI